MIKLRNEEMQTKNNKTISYCIQLLIILLVLLSINTQSSAQPTTKISIITPTQPIFIGDSFQIILFCEPAEILGGWSLTLQFTPGYFQITNITPSEPWSSFFDPGTINTTDGRVTNIQTWTTEPAPATNHTLCTIQCTALNLGTCLVSLQSLQLTNNTFISIPITTTNLTLNIEQQPSEDINGADDESVEDLNGSLTDSDNDGIYDQYKNNTTNTQTKTTQQDNGNYLIDNDGDSTWDYIYDPTTKTLTEYQKGEEKPAEENTLPFYILIFLLAVLFGFLVIVLVKRKKKTDK